MPSTAETVVDVRALIKKPGATMSLDRSMPAPGDMSDDIVRMGPDVRVTAIVESVVDGLLVRGAVIAPARVSCARCLVEWDDEIRSDVIELFSTDDGADEVEPGYAIDDGTIDFDTMIRDAIADALQVRPLCRPDCAGLCPTCGADLNLTEPGSPSHAASGPRSRPDAARCGGHPEQHDPRWAALSDLQLPDNR